MSKTPLTRQQMAWCVAQDIPDGSYVNLGIGLPQLVSNCIPAGREIVFHAENGILGMGPAPPHGQGDPYLVSPGKTPVTLLPGGCYFHHADSFAMTRGGHVDVAVLGAMQVSAGGDLANWKVKGETLGGIGGAMDIAVGAKQVFALMTHVTREREPKIVAALTYPLTALRCVTRIYTDVAIIEVTRHGLLLRSLACGYTIADVQRVTGASLQAAQDIAEIEAPAFTS